MGGAQISYSRKGAAKVFEAGRVTDGKYYVSILVEMDQERIPPNHFQAGVVSINGDSGILWDGKSFGCPPTLGQQEKKLVKLQRQLANKEKGSNNYNKQKKKIVLCRERISNIRRDYCHQVSHEIISQNQVIVLEKRDSDKNIGQIKGAAGTVWYELARQLEYKAKWNGWTFEIF